MATQRVARPVGADGRRHRRRVADVLLDRVTSSSGRPSKKRCRAAACPSSGASTASRSGARGHRSSWGAGRLRDLRNSEIAGMLTWWAVRPTTWPMWPASSRSSCLSADPTSPSAGSEDARRDDVVAHGDDVEVGRAACRAATPRRPPSRSGVVDEGVVAHEHLHASAPPRAPGRARGRVAQPVIRWCDSHQPVVPQVVQQVRVLRQLLGGLVQPEVLLQDVDRDVAGVVEDVRDLQVALLQAVREHAGVGEVDRGGEGGQPGERQLGVGGGGEQRQHPAEAVADERHVRAAGQPADPADRVRAASRSA